MPPPRPTVRPGRFVLWRAAATMFAAHPLLGVGPDNFRLAYGAYAGLPGADARMHSNNMYLEMLAGGGLVVGAAFLWLVWRAAAQLRAARASTPRRRIRRRALGDRRRGAGDCAARAGRFVSQLRADLRARSR